MSYVPIPTAQNVNLYYQTANIGERILAFLIDAFLLMLYLFALSRFMGLLEPLFSDSWTEIGMYSLLSLPVFFYSLYMNILFDGRTVGKMVLKTRIVSSTGEPVHWSNYMITWMLRLVDIWMFLGSIGVFSIVFSEKNQRLGDAAAGILVISTRNTTKISHTILSEVAEEHHPQFSTVTQLSDKDVRLIKEAYISARRSKDYRTLNKLRQRIESILQVKSEMYDEPFIQTVLKDYTYYTQDF